MTKPVSVDFQFTVQQRGRGARKQMVEGNGESKEPKKSLERIPRISRYMALAIHFEDLIKQGVVTDYADLARLGHVTRARVTQIMNLRLLTPEIQEHLLHCETSGQLNCPLQLKELQRLASHYDWRKQRVQWRQQNRDFD
jgi:hypothetical protein